MKFINLTRHTEIGANSYYVEIGTHRLLLDCGMHPKNTGEDALPLFKAIADCEVEAILISHAHQDHIGTLPLAMRRFPGARIFMTDATADVGSVLLHNSVNVMTRQREEIGEMSYPLFTHREIDRASERWRWCPLRQRISIAGERAAQHEKETLTFEFFDAGHVLGSTGIMLRAEGQTVFYTGDVNFDDQTIMQAAVFPDENIDVLIIECTRGDHAKPEGWTRAGEERRLAEALAAAFEREACVLIPVFALGKTQEILAMLYKFRHQRLLPEFPIYIGGLSSKFTDTYDRRAHVTHRQLPRLKLIRDVGPFILNDETVRDTPVRGGRVYVLSSGMMIPKTLSNVFARRIIEDPQHSIFFVGYANPESPAGLLRDAGRGGEVTLDPDKPPQRIRCNIEQFQFSAHATRESLIDYAKRISPKKNLLVHGDPPAVEWMRTTLSGELPNVEIIVPTPGVELDL
ncbi:MAG: MBL fold metallo-hydrolase [Verrucomicrobia bacterium]|nr:MAG: MBL fold metallo-hydrolase [Verrucomicrobiota bacterium]PYL74716.1 MAG: MBL fold metallo-hydrolase [Verrucomicrobiota bacterium]